MAPVKQLPSVVENQSLCVRATSCMSVERNGGKKTMRRENELDVRVDIAALSV